MQLAIYKHGQGFELGTAKNKSRKSPERDLNLGLPDCAWSLTTRPCCLLNPLSPNIHIQILQTGLYTFP